MSTRELLYILVAIAVVALIIRTQLKPRPIRENASTRRTMILAVIGAAELYNAANGKSIGAPTIAWVLASLVLGGALGAVRALTNKIWRSPDGAALTQGTWLTGCLWIASLAAHFVLQIAINHSTKIAGFGASSLLLYIAVTLGVQREVLRARAAGARDRPTTA